MAPIRWLIFILTATAALASPERVYSVEGVVTAGLSEDLVTIAHQDIPGFMPAMTMPFRVDPGARNAAAALRPGDRVRFKFAVAETSRAFDFERLGSAAATAPSGQLADTKPRRIREGDAVPSFTLTDQDGRPFTATDLLGRRTVLTFIFTRCAVPEFCPRMSKHFQTLQQRLQSSPPADPPAQLVSVSFDPGFDTPAVLKAYGERYGADAALWRLCTGSIEQVRTLTRLFAVHIEPSAAILDHTLATAIIGPDGRVCEILRGNQWTADQALAALNAAP